MAADTEADVPTEAAAAVAADTEVAAAVDTEASLTASIFPISSREMKNKKKNKKTYKTNRVAQWL